MKLTRSFLNWWKSFCWHVSTFLDLFSPRMQKKPAVCFSWSKTQQNSRTLELISCWIKSLTNKSGYRLLKHGPQHLKSLLRNLRWILLKLINCQNFHLYPYNPSFPHLEHHLVESFIWKSLPWLIKNILTVLKYYYSTKFLKLGPTLAMELEKWLSLPSKTVLPKCFLGLPSLM